MILIRTLKNRSLIRNLLHNLPPLSTYEFSASSSQMPMDKILKAASRKKCNTAQDAMFCAMIFQLFSRNSPSTPKQQADMTNEINRMVSNSLEYIQQLSLLETLVFGNKCMGLLVTKKVKIDSKNLTVLIQKINTKIVAGVERDHEGKHAPQIISYVKKLLQLKKDDLAEEVINYLVAKPKKETEVIQIINALCTMKSKSKLSLQKSIQKLLENEIGCKVEQLALTSKLIDQSVLKIFFQFNFQIKQPYNCVPRWMFVLTQKLRQKYTSPQFHISSLKKISFFRYYRRMLTSPILISQCYFTVDMHKFLPDYFRRISELFDYFDDEPMEQKITSFLFCFEPYLAFFQLYPMYETEEAVADVCQSAIKIFERYFAPAHLKESNSEQLLRICQLMAQYSLIFESLQRRYKGHPTLMKSFPKILHKILQIYTFSFSKYETSPEKFYFFTPLLPIIAKFSSHPSLNNSYKVQALSLSNRLIKAIQKLGKNKILDFYQGLEKVDFVSICFLTSRYLGLRMGQDFTEIFQQIKKTSLITCIETIVNCILVREQVIKKQLIELCSTLRQQMQNFLVEKNQSRKERQQKFYGRKSLTGFRFKSYEEELVGNFILLFKVEQKGMQVEPNLYRYWFLENKSIIEAYFSPTDSILFEKSWGILRNNLRYLNYLTQESGVDIISQISRLVQEGNQCQVDFLQKYQAMFNDRQIYHILYTKTDELAELKYSWSMEFLVDCVIRIGKQKNHGNENELVKNKNNKKLQEEFASQRLSLFKLIELLSFSALDHREPLQFSTFRSQAICKLLNRSLERIISAVEQNKSEKPEQGKSKQLIYCSLPMDQIIYFLSQQNELHADSWIRMLQPQYLLSFMEGKHSKVAQYNILLSFDTNSENNKKLHHAFISQELSNNQTEIEALDSPAGIYQRTFLSSVVKYYFYFLQPSRSRNDIIECARLVADSKLLSEEEVLEYWLNRNIVMKTTHDQLIEACLQRVLRLKEVTYTQFKTILNCILTLFTNGRIQNYFRFDQLKRQRLAQWVQSNFVNFTELKLYPFLIDYFVLLRAFPCLSILGDLVQPAINQNLRKNNIGVLEQIYQARYKLSKKNIQEVKNILVRAKFRCLTQNYFNLSLNIEFRVEFILKIVWGAALMQDAELGTWVWENFLKNLDDGGIEEYLLVKEHRTNLFALVMRYRISGKVSCCGIQNILSRLGQRFQEQMQRSLSKVQEERSSNLAKSQYTSVRIKGSEMCVYREKSRGKFIYLTKEQNPSPQEYIESLYIRTLQHIELELRSIN